MTESHNGMNIKQNPRKLSRTKSGICILKLTKYHTVQRKTDLEAVKNTVLQNKENLVIIRSLHSNIQSKTTVEQCFILIREKSSRQVFYI